MSNASIWMLWENWESLFDLESWSQLLYIWCVQNENKICNETNYKSLKTVLMKLEQTEPLKCQNRFLLFLNKKLSKKLSQQHFCYRLFLFFAAFILALQDFSSTISWGIRIHRLKCFMYWMFSTEALFLHTYTLCIFFYTVGKNAQLSCWKRHHLAACPDYSCHWLKMMLPLLSSLFPSTFFSSSFLHSRNLTCIHRFSNKLCLLTIFFLFLTPWIKIKLIQYKCLFNFFAISHILVSVRVPYFLFYFDKSLLICVVFSLTSSVLLYLIYATYSPS